MSNYKRLKSLLVITLLLSYSLASCYLAQYHIHLSAGSFLIHEDLRDELNEDVGNNIIFYKGGANPLYESSGFRQINNIIAYKCENVGDVYDSFYSQIDSYVVTNSTSKERDNKSWLFEFSYELDSSNNIFLFGFEGAPKLKIPVSVVSSAISLILPVKFNASYNSLKETVGGPFFAYPPLRNRYKDILGQSSSMEKDENALDGIEHNTTYKFKSISQIEPFRKVIFRY